MKRFLVPDDWESGAVDLEGRIWKLEQRVLAHEQWRKEMQNELIRLEANLSRIKQLAASLEKLR